MKKLINKFKELAILTKIFIFIDLFVVACFIFVYGPNKYAETFWITTAMETGTHRYFAYIFFSEKEVAKVMNANKLIALEEETDVSQITIGNLEKRTTYDSIYEKEVLEHDENDKYKLISFKYGEFDAFIIAVYDPKTVEVGYAQNLPYGYDLLTEIVSNNNAIGGINGGGYSWYDYKPYGLIVHDGKVVHSSGYGSYTSAALTYDGVLIAGNISVNDIASKNIKEAVSFGPVLIANGKSAGVMGTGGSGMNPRTAIAQRKDGIILMLVVNGYNQNMSWKGRGGVYYSDLITILERYGAYNAVNMDGGSSTTMVLNDKLVNSPVEPVKNGQDYIKSAWIFK